mgnify:CR=1 FL=1
MTVLRCSFSPRQRAAQRRDGIPAQSALNNVRPWGVTEEKQDSATAATTKIHQERQAMHALKKCWIAAALCATLGAAQAQLLVGQTAGFTG